MDVRAALLEGEQRHRRPRDVVHKKSRRNATFPAKTRFATIAIADQVEVVYRIAASSPALSTSGVCCLIDLTHQLRRPGRLALLTRASSSKSALGCGQRDGQKRVDTARLHPATSRPASLHSQTQKAAGPTPTPKFTIIAAKIDGSQFNATSGLEQPSIRECRASRHLE
jgi:hypothetical protein